MQTEQIIKLVIELGNMVLSALLLLLLFRLSRNSKGTINNEYLNTITPEIVKIAKNCFPLGKLTQITKYAKDMIKTRAKIDEQKISNKDIKKAIKNEINKPLEPLKPIEKVDYEKSISLSKILPENQEIKGE